MNYKIFLNQLFEIKNIHWAFALTKQQQYKFNFKNSDEVINNIAFVPINKRQKKELLDILKNKTVTIDRINKFIEMKYRDFLKSYFNHNKLIEKYMEYFYEWIEITTKDKIDIKVINRIKKNIDTNNSLFWFFLTKKIYTLEKNDESYNLIRYIKKNKIIDKNHIKYNELTLYEFYSLKMSKDYLYDKKWRNKLCTLAKKLNNFKKLQITTLLECNLLNNDIELFNKNFKKYELEIFTWNISDILNIYELSIYIGLSEIIKKLKNILQLKDIKAYIGFNEYLIYQFLNSIYNYELSQNYKQRLKNKFDFYHYEWYLKNKNINH